MVWIYYNLIILLIRVQQFYFHVFTTANNSVINIFVCIILDTDTYFYGA